MLAPSPNQNQPLPQGHEPAEACLSGCSPDRSHLQKAFGDARWGWGFRESPLSSGNVLRSWASPGRGMGTVRQHLPHRALAWRRMQEQGRHVGHASPDTFQLFLGLQVFFYVFSHPQRYLFSISLPSLSWKLREASAATMPKGPRYPAFHLLRARSV